MGPRKDLLRLSQQYQDLAGRHDNLLATTVARLIDLESSLAALQDGLPRVGFGQTKRQIAESRRRIESIAQALREELDICSGERPLLVAHTGTARTVLAIMATSFMSFLVGEANDEVDLRALAEPVVEAWQAADESSAEALKVGQLVIDAATELSEADTGWDDFQPPMTDQLNRLMIDAEAAMRRTAETMRRDGDLTTDVVYRSKMVEAQAADIAGLRIHALNEEAAPTTQSIGSVLRSAREFRDPSDPPRAANDFANAEAALSRLMRNLEQARRTTLSDNA